MNKKYKLLWITDPHLNFVPEAQIKDFCSKILTYKPQAVVITGDIAEAPSVIDYLGFMNLQLQNQCPIFFVLGNHDYYRSSIANVRTELRQLFTYDETSKKIKEPKLGWLGSSGIIPLTEKTALVGHDGWYDGLYADWFQSKVWLHDYNLIWDLADTVCHDRKQKFARINELSLESARYVKKQLKEAFKKYENVFVATHVSPFRENSVYRGKISDDDWMPHFSSKHMGDMLLEISKENPTKNITVLCGHSHGSADNQITTNIRCITGKAQYRFPSIADVFEIE